MGRLGVRACVLCVADRHEGNGGGSRLEPGPRSNGVFAAELDRHLAFIALNLTPPKAGGVATWNKSEWGVRDGWEGESKRHHLTRA